MEETNMKKRLLLFLTLMILIGAVSFALAEEWTCPSCASLVEGNFCSNCGTARPDGAAAVTAGTVSESSLAAIATATSRTPITILPSPDKYTWYVQDYVGRNLASVGYTSLGGDRLDRYGAGYLDLILVTQDGTYIDIEDEDMLRQYVVIGQSLEPNTEIKYVFSKDSKGEEYSNLVDSQNYEEIDLLVARIDGMVYNEPVAYEPIAIHASPDKYTQYIRNYVGKNLAAVGYTSLGGQRMDAYSHGYIQFVLSATNGAYIDLDDEQQLASYVVVCQDIAPNTEMRLIYRKDSKGNEYSNLVESQSYERITLTLQRVNTPPKSAASSAMVTDSTEGNSDENSRQAPVAAIGSPIKSGQFTYVVMEDGTAQITTYSGNQSSVSIPSSLDGYDVTSIGSSAFEGHAEIKDIIMWADIVDFGEAAFKGCTKLKSISIPGSAKVIGPSAFEGCTSLETVIIWGDITRIGSAAFKGCIDLDSISIPSSAEIIEESAFEGCTDLETVIIWGDTNIGNSAFRGCISLDDISISSGTEFIGDYAFEGCTDLETVIIWGDSTIIGTDAFANCPNLDRIL